MSTGSAQPFTSTFSASEYAVLAELDLRPVGQAFGASVFQTGPAWLPWPDGWPRASGLTSAGVPADGWRWSGRPYVVLDTLMAAWDQVRRQARDRLVEHAQRLGGDVVVGVDLRLREGELGRATIECVISGTAARYGASQHAAWPALSDLPGQELWQLWQAGYLPAGLCMATSVVFVPLSPLARLRSVVAKTGEDERLSRAHAAARELLRQRLAAQAVDGEGIVGVQMSSRVSGEELSTGLLPGRAEGLEVHGLVVEMHATATVIRQADATTRHPPETVVATGRPVHARDARGRVRSPS